MKRIISLALFFVLLLGVVFPNVQTVVATGETADPAQGTQTEAPAEPVEPVDPVEPEQLKASDALIKLLKYEEGFVKYPVWDYSQYTVGYGTRCPNDMVDYYKAHGITESEAELLLRNYLNNTENSIRRNLIEKYDLKLNQGQFDALVSFSYNLGTGWMSDTTSNIFLKVVNGATGNDLIDAFARWCNAGGVVNYVLLRRRLSEANMYLNGIYEHSKPDNYCYVTYNGNGGSISHRAQGYDCNFEAAPAVTATNGNYTFAGWYTAQVGGTKVESLTAEHHGKVLYAHWAELGGGDDVTDEEGVTVTITLKSDIVNIRKGPGTNYAIVGSARYGQTYTITNVVENGGFLWGQFSGGWMVLQYTNYDEVAKEELPETPNTTEPEETEPEVTEPETTEPETTEPEATEPPTTEPEATEPPATDPEKPAAVEGYVNADPYLCVRQGPGTGYATVDTLVTGAKVTITEQKNVGSMVWGKVSNGWISMSYVRILEEPVPEKPATKPETKPENTTGKMGTVTCSELRIRSGAGVNYGVAGWYYKGDKVTILEEKKVDTTVWGKTSKGWISMDYVAFDQAEEAPPVTGNPPEPTEPDTPTVSPEPDQITGIVTSKDDLRIRSGAGTSYSIVGFLSNGAKVTISEKKVIGGTTWGKIAQGWISLDYVKLDSNDADAGKPETPAAVTKTVDCSCLCVRSGAGTSYSLAGYLYRGAKVTVTETKTVGGVEWGKISNGWVCMDYLK